MDRTWSIVSGSTPPRNFTPSSYRNSPNRSGVATATSSRAPRVSTVSVGTAELPGAPWLLGLTWYSARKAWSIPTIADSWMDAPMIIVKLTSARPIISAEAVAAVRRGERSAFSLAS